jgi:hypothetical protein
VPVRRQVSSGWRDPGGTAGALLLPPPPLDCVCVLTLCMGHRVPVLPHGRPPGRVLTARLDLLRLDPVPVRWAFAVLWVCVVVGPLLPAAAGGRGSVLPGSPSVPPGTPVGLVAVCVAPYLRLRLGTVWLCALGRCRCCGCCYWPCTPVFPLARWLQDPPVLEPVLEVHAVRERPLLSLCFPRTMPRGWGAGGAPFSCPCGGCGCSMLQWLRPSAART